MTSAEGEATCRGRGHMQSFSLLGLENHFGRSVMACIVVHEALRALRCVKPTVEEAMHGSFDGVCMAPLLTCLTIFIFGKSFPLVTCPSE